ncbi:YraN family protein [Kitasatospora sp. GP82]|uniref:YraN family protein n=1 Tax=Kitasatospora sp. GP82 TaxID=3035089 RepID=UPI0024760A9F|nr:YraN family protein [Kitasatospora sp. GP82]MDH6129176.1 putative endonuclease [Kitasatospora sp. GP82]
MKSSNNGLGRYGEEVAARWLAAGGLRILERNWRCAEGELDIVALDGDTLAVCEVKTRSERGFQQPSEGIDRTKAERLRHLAERWLGERWPAHFVRLAQTVAVDGPGADADPVAKAQVAKAQAASEVRSVPLPPGGVRIDLIAVVNRLKGAAQIEHHRGAV